MYTINLGSVARLTRYSSCLNMLRSAIRSETNSVYWWRDLKSKLSVFLNILNCETESKQTNTNFLWSQVRSLPKSAVA